MACATWRQAPGLVCIVKQGEQRGGIMTEFHLVQYPMERKTRSDGQETHATRLICSAACFIIEVTTCRTLNCDIKDSVAETMTEYVRGHRLKNCNGSNRSAL